MLARSSMASADFTHHGRTKLCLLQTRLAKIAGCAVVHELLEGPPLLTIVGISAVQA